MQLQAAVKAGSMKDIARTAICYGRKAHMALCVLKKAATRDITDKALVAKIDMYIAAVEMALLFISMAIVLKHAVKIAVMAAIAVLLYKIMKYWGNKR